MRIKTESINLGVDSFFEGQGKGKDNTKRRLDKNTKYATRHVLRTCGNSTHA